MLPLPLCLIPRIVHLVDAYSIQSILKQAASKIELGEACILLGLVLKQSRTYLLTFPETELTLEQVQIFFALVDRRVIGEPIAYLTGEKEFWSLPLNVTPAVLIPRPETELLVELILKQFGERVDLRVLDLGTGSGAIALALASEQPNWQITAVDQSEAALEVARENARRLNMSSIDFIGSSWFENVTGQFDVIVSNPPYIAEGDIHLAQGDLRFEPQRALVAGKTGLADIITISHRAKSYLKPQGTLFFEHGFDQADAVTALLREQGFQSVETFRDLAGLDRVTCGSY
jgi:release factor glutamine methyltransferase